MNESGFERLVARTYDAALDESAWRAVLSEIRQATSAVAGGLLRHSRRSQDITAKLIQGVDQSFADSYRIHYRLRIPWVDLPTFYQPGIVRTDRTIDQHYGRSDSFKSTEYFSDWMAPQGFRHIMRTVLHHSGDDSVSLFLFRERRQGPFRGQAQSTFRRLVPHLMRATEIHHRYGLLEAQSTLATETIEQLSSGVIYLDARAHVLGANRVAEEILQHGDGLEVAGRRVAPSQAGSRARFAASVERALRSGTSAGNATEIISLPRPTGRVPLAVAVVPVTSETTVFRQPRPSVVLLVTDPELRLPVGIDTLMTVYGLTRSEACLAAQLASGKSLRDAAKALGIRYETARSYLKVVFQKTQTQRQAELVRLLLATGV